MIKPNVPQQHPRIHHRNMLMYCWCCGSRTGCSKVQYIWSSRFDSLKVQRVDTMQLLVRTTTYILTPFRHFPGLLGLRGENWQNYSPNFSFTSSPFSAQMSDFFSFISTISPPSLTSVHYVLVYLKLFFQIPKHCLHADTVLTAAHSFKSLFHVL